MENVADQVGSLRVADPGVTRARGRLNTGDDNELQNDKRVFEKIG
jgi:hypothetical protein